MTERTIPHKFAVRCLDQGITKWHYYTIYEYPDSNYHKNCCASNKHCYAGKAASRLMWHLMNNTSGIFEVREVGNKEIIKLQWDDDNYYGWYMVN